MLDRLARLGITVPDRASDTWHIVMQALEDAARVLPAFDENDAIEICRDLITEAERMIAQISGQPVARGGRPRVEVNMTQVEQLRDAGQSARAIAGTTGVGREVIRRRLKEAGAKK